MKTAKKSGKRLFVLRLFILLGLAAVFDTLAMAAGQPTISVESASGSVGEQVMVQVLIENNPGVVGVYLDIDYDSSKLRLVDAQDTGLLNGKLFPENYSLVPYGLTWDDSLNPDNTKNGAIAKLTFELLKDCQSEEIRVSSPAGIVNYDLEFVSFTFKSGTIRAEGAVQESGTADNGNKPSTTPNSDTIRDASTTTIASDTSDDSSSDESPSADSNSISGGVSDGHTHVYTEEVTAPTCTEDGFTTYTCTLCGDSYTDTPVSALGHDYVETSTPATCTEPGVSTFTCSRCKKRYNTSGTPPLGHEYKPAPSEGKRVYICARCNARIKKKADTSAYLLPIILAAILCVLLATFFYIRSRRKKKVRGAK